MKTKNELFRQLPKVDECLLKLETYVQEHKIPHRLAKKAVQETIEKIRGSLIQGNTKYLPETANAWDTLFIEAMTELTRSNLRRVINGTGVVVHTNLGRSLLSDEVTRQLSMASSHYTNLELNLKTGKRGSRYSLVEEIICDLSGAEAALVVNNNAAAVLIVLDTLAKEREVIISRGQLVEIGGSFRIPDVMEKSGAHLVEVGATNRTHLYDFENAITEHTALLLRVHTSNFRIIGYTSQVSAEELVELGGKYDIPVMEDLGSGSLTDLSRFGLPPEPTVQQVVKAGVDVVTFSADKLLGGPQAGIIAGNKRIIDQIKKNPLNRALRIDKFTLASLESTLRDYYEPETVLQKNQTLRMISEAPALIKKRAQRLRRRIAAKIQPVCQALVTPTISRVGGGALPEYGLDSWALALGPTQVDVATLERDFRSLAVPLIGRIEHDRFLIDCRTVLDGDVAELGELLISYFTQDT
jgi:L-seryl-tRNA(Ser) seleniumtransferase